MINQRRSTYPDREPVQTTGATSIRRMTSATGVPVSACFSANAICSSVYLDFFMSSSLPKGFSRPENSRSNWAKKRMARPVGKRFVSNVLSSLRKRIRPFDMKPLAKMEIRASWSS